MLEVELKNFPFLEKEGFGLLTDEDADRFFEELRRKKDGENGRLRGFIPLQIGRKGIVFEGLDELGLTEPQGPISVVYSERDGSFRASASVARAKYPFYTDNRYCVERLGMSAIRAPLTGRALGRWGNRRTLIQDAHGKLWTVRIGFSAINELMIRNIMPRLPEPKRRIKKQTLIMLWL